MGMVDMSNTNNNPPTSRTKDFFASPALSLSLAGIFRDARANAVGQASSVGSGGGGGRRDDQTVEISSENSGLLRSRSVDENFDNELEDHDLDDDFDEDDDGDKKKKKKKRKKYHRHTSEQIREMEGSSLGRTKFTDKSYGLLISPVRSLEWLRSAPLSFTQESSPLSSVSLRNLLLLKVECRKCCLLQFCSYIGVFHRIFEWVVSSSKFVPVRDFGKIYFPQTHDPA